MSLSTRQQILNEQDSKKLVLRAEAIQNGIFSAVFGAFEQVLATAAKVALFPAVTLISLYKTYLAWKDYRQAKNKHLGKQLSLGAEILAVGGEAVAVTAAVAGFFGLSLLGAAVIPALFLASVALKFTSHLVQTIYYGIKCLSDKTRSKNHEENRRQYWSNLKSTFVLGVAGAAVGLLMLVPAFNLAVLSAGLVTAVKAIGAVVLGMNALFTARSAYKIHQQEKQKKLASDQAKAEQLQEVNFEEDTVLLNPAMPEEGEVLGISRTYYHEDDMDVPLPEEDAQLLAMPRLTILPYYASEKDLSIDKLILTMEKNSSPLEFLRDFLTQAKKGLQTDLRIVSSDPKKIEDSDIKLNLDGQLPDLGILPWNIQNQKRKDKLHAVCLLEKLLELNAKPAGQEKKQYVNIGDTTRSETIEDVKSLMTYLDKTKKTDNVFKSSFNGVGRIQKLFVLVDHYLKTPELQFSNTTGFASDTRPLQLM